MRTSVGESSGGRERAAKGLRDARTRQPKSRRSSALVPAGGSGRQPGQACACAPARAKRLPFTNSPRALAPHPISGWHSGLWRRSCVDCLRQRRSSGCIAWVLLRGRSRRRRRGRRVQGSRRLCPYACPLLLVSCAFTENQASEPSLVHAPYTDYYKPAADSSRPKDVNGKWKDACPSLAIHE